MYIIFSSSSVGTFGAPPPPPYSKKLATLLMQIDYKKIKRKENIADVQLKLYQNQHTDAS